LQSRGSGGGVAQHRMAWETRERGRPYYYRSVRDGEKVRKEYVGAGEIAELCAHADETIRCSREERRERERRELERLEALAALALDLDEAAAILVRAHLVAAGCHQRKGEWRRMRESA
jgi:hypothetical protein